MNRYTSEGRVLPDLKHLSNLGGLAAAGEALGLGAQIGGGGQDALYVDILKSRWLGDQVLDETYTYKVRSWMFGEPETRATTLLGYFKEKNKDKGFKALMSVINIKRDVKTNLVTITVETRSPELSQAVVKKALTLLDQYLIEKVQTQGKAKAIYLEQRLKEAAIEFQKAEDGLARFQANNRTYSSSSDPAVRLRGQHLENDLELHKQLFSQLTYQLEQARLDEKKDVPTLSILDSGTLPIQKSGPSRGFWTMVTFFIVGGAHFCWGNRVRLSKYLSSEDPL
ncbi:hypothetical protein [Geothrix oryzisoli]|uniref:hypothetical protein n=1 Tax=Geothrix oryzisoli TaxID=2922721 RepID=UPI001FABDF77|nr:hypothetical protein [Geothrix oryzisoli]